MPENLHRNILSYVLYQDCSIELLSRIFFLQPNCNAKYSQHKAKRKLILFTTVIKRVRVYAFSLRRHNFLRECKAVNRGKYDVIFLFLSFFEKLKIQIGAPDWISKMYCNF